MEESETELTCSRLFRPRYYSYTLIKAFVNNVSSQMSQQANGNASQG